MIMDNRKYESYKLALEYDDERTYKNYRNAFKAFMRYDGSATLYGVNEQGDVEVIFSK